MALRTAPLHMSTLFPDHIIVKAEEQICHHQDKHNPGPPRKAPHYHPYTQGRKQHQQKSDLKSVPPPAWKQIRKRGQKPSRNKASSYTQQPAKGQKTYK